MQVFIVIKEYGDYTTVIEGVYSDLTLAHNAVEKLRLKGSDGIMSHSFKIETFTVHGTTSPIPVIKGRVEQVIVPVWPD